VFDLDVRDLNCSFKLFRRDVLRALPLESDDFFIDTEIVVRLHRAGSATSSAGSRTFPAWPAARRCGSPTSRGRSGRGPHAGEDQVRAATLTAGIAASSPAVSCSSRPRPRPPPPTR
jgi:hypothetical protein